MGKKDMKKKECAPIGMKHRREVAQQSGRLPTTLVTTYSESFLQLLKDTPGMCDPLRQAPVYKSMKLHMDLMRMKIKKINLGINDKEADLAYLEVMV